MRVVGEVLVEGIPIEVRSMAPREEVRVAPKIRRIPLRARSEEERRTPVPLEQRTPVAAERHMLEERCSLVAAEPRTAVAERYTIVEAAHRTQAEERRKQEHRTQVEVHHMKVAAKRHNLAACTHPQEERRSSPAEDSYKACSRLREAGSRTCWC
jgi:hypothetical protein